MLARAVCWQVFCLPGISHAVVCACRHVPEQQQSGVRFGQAQGEQVVDIDPLPGRLVVFLSGAIDHAVLPSHQARVALTAWCR